MIYCMWFQIHVSGSSIVIDCITYTGLCYCSCCANNKPTCNSDSVQKQAQLSQRDRLILRVIEYLVKSLKVIRNVTLE